MAKELNRILEGAARFGASDVHLSAGHSPCLRVDGVLRPVQAEAINSEQLERYLKGIMPEPLENEFRRTRNVDFAYEYGSENRYRVNAYLERGRLKVVLRAVSLTPPDIDALDLPATLKRVALLPRGMVVVTGTTGSGKSTTLAAMLNYLNHTQSRCLITIEDPIETVYANEKSIVTQREVGPDVPDFLSGLVQALRQDPDVILIGEMRRAETMRVVITAAETGHTVFTTLHTTNAVQTIERIVASFPEEERDLVREQLAFNLRCVVSQRLARRKGGKGRIAAMEIMVVTAMIEKMIYENRIREVAGIVTGREEGMCSFDQNLADLVRAEKIDQAEAERLCDDVYALRRFIQGVQSTGESGGIIAGFM